MIKRFECNGQTEQWTETMEMPLGRIMTISLPIDKVIKSEKSNTGFFWRSRK